MATWKLTFERFLSTVASEVSEEVSRTVEELPASVTLMLELAFPDHVLGESFLWLPFDDIKIVVLRGLADLALITYEFGGEVLASYLGYMVTLFNTKLG